MVTLTTWLLRRQGKAVAPLPQQLRTQQHPLLIVHAQEEDRAATDSRQWVYLGTLKSGMRVPAIGAGMKEHDHLTRERIAGGDSGSLEAIAAEKQHVASPQ